jgi:tetratricopeptide (TPR) repeat protein
MTEDSAEILVARARAANKSGDVDDAERLYRESLVICREIGDRKGEADALNSLGTIKQNRGDLGEAERLYRESLAICREINDRKREATLLNNLGIIEQNRGDLTGAERLYRESLAIYREINDREREANSLNYLGIIEDNRGDLGEAERLYRESLVIYIEIGNLKGEFNSLFILGINADKRGELDEAKGFYQNSLKIAQELGDLESQTLLYKNLARVAEAMTEKETAEGFHQAALETKRKQSNDENHTQALSKHNKILSNFHSIPRAFLEFLWTIPLEDAMEKTAINDRKSSYRMWDRVSQHTHSAHEHPEVYLASVLYNQTAFRLGAVGVNGIQIKQALEDACSLEHPYEPEQLAEGIQKHYFLKYFIPELSSFIPLQIFEESQRSREIKMSKLDFVNILTKLTMGPEWYNVILPFYKMWILCQAKIKQKGNIASKKSILLSFLKHRKWANAYYNVNDNEIYLSYGLPAHHPLIGQLRSITTDLPVGIKSITKRKEGENFIHLYKKYMNALTCSLTFVNCASKLTRVGKIFQKELVFEIVKKEQQELGEALYRSKRNEPYNPFPNTSKPQKNSEQVSGQVISEYIVNNDSYLLPLVINGDAGMGKTISMTQFALQCCTGIHEKMEAGIEKQIRSLPLPIFVKAKRFDEGVSDISPRIMIESLPELMEHMREEEIHSLLHLWSELSQDSNHIYFVDGLDECRSNEEAARLVKILRDSNVKNSGREASIDQGYHLEAARAPTMILSTRPSYYEIVKENLGTHGCLSMKAEEDYYTKNELSELMPQRLCDAWGITRESGKKLSNLFEDYEEILIHPLFVGWFCFLIQEDQLEKVDDLSGETQIKKNNLIRKIIDVGVQSSLKRREADVLPNRDDEFISLLTKFVSVSFHYQIDDPNLVLERVEELYFDKQISEKNKHSILHDCGILFLAGDKIEWTHTTVPEIIYADFYFNQSDSFRLGPMKQSTPIVDRIAQLTSENGTYKTYDSASLLLRHKYFSTAEFEKYLWEVFAIWDNEFDNILTHDGTKIVCNQNLQNESKQSELARLYLAAMGTKKRFSLPMQHFDQEKLEPIVKDLYRISNDPFCFDLISFDAGNGIPLESMRIDKINSSSLVRNCFRYYRQLLNYITPELANPSNTIFMMHTLADDYTGIFDVDLINGWFKHEVDDVAGSWLGGNEHDTLLPENWYMTRKSLVDHITQQYVETAYSALFGERNYQNAIEFLWNEMENLNIDVVVGGGDEVDVVEWNFIEYMLVKGQINSYGNFWDKDTGNVRDRFDTNGHITRGFLLMPIVNKFLRMPLKETELDLSDPIWEIYESIEPSLELVMQYMENL